MVSSNFVKLVCGFTLFYFSIGALLFLEGWSQRFRGEGIERNQANSDGSGCLWRVTDKNQFVCSGEKQHYITINKTTFVKIVSVICHLSKIKKVSIIIFTQFYKFKYIS